MTNLDPKIASSIKNLLDYLHGKKLLILGFGREGQSTYNFLRSNLPHRLLTLADQNANLLDSHPELRSDPHLNFILGDHYLDSLTDYDLILKSPGISLKNLNLSLIAPKITSQLELLLQFFPLQTIGVTATKGKSTTSSLINAILEDQGISTFLLGNIGQPVFGQLSHFRADSTLILEMSSHQLEFMHHSPHIALFLNLSEEHLDHYRSFVAYAEAKCNIYRQQTPRDYLLYNIDDKALSSFIKSPSATVITISSNPRPMLTPKTQSVLPDFYRQDNLIFHHGQPIYDATSPRQLLGDHNLTNIMFALAVSDLLHLDHTKTLETIQNFHPLPHRLELVGEFNGVRYYDNSIATVPAATIAAISALGDVDTLIIGGMDRGIDYSDFIDFLRSSSVAHIICMPKTGHDIGRELPPEKVKFVDTLEEAVIAAQGLTQKGKICLLSPTAASYGFFKNFEEKGDQFQALVRKQKSKQEI